MFSQAFILEISKTLARFLMSFLCPRPEGSGANCFTGVPLSVFLFVHLSIQNLTLKLNISLLLLNLYGYKAHISYEDTSDRYTSADTKVKVICQSQGQISRSHFSKEMAVLGALLFHKHILFFRRFPRTLHNYVGHRRNTHILPGACCWTTSQKRSNRCLE